VLDLDPQTGRDPLEDFEVIGDELRRYSAALAERPQIVVANKADIPEAAERRQRVEEFCARRRLPLHVISAATGAGLRDLLHGIAGRLEGGGWLRAAS
jgi:GTP-binding protein